MAIDFPSSPTEGQVLHVSKGNSMVYRGGYWRAAPMKTALSQNLLGNPAMLVSQQNADVMSPITASNGGYYAADQWHGRWSVVSAAIGATRWPIIGASGLRFNTVYIRTTTPKASLATADYAIITQHVEGVKVAALKWGTSAAVPALLKFTTIISATTAKGLYSVRVSNAPVTHSYIATFNCPAGDVWQVHTIPIPPPPIGTTWATDEVVGLKLDFTVAIGTAYHGVSGWQSGDLYAIPGQANGVSAAGDWHVGQVGLHADPYDTREGPIWQTPALPDEITRSQRYWYRAFGLRGLAPSATLFNSADMEHPVPMRVKPAAALVGAVKAFDAVAAPTVTSISANQSNRWTLELNTGTTGLTAGRSVSNYWTSQDVYIAADARP
jgi:hypothetical protein